MAPTRQTDSHWDPEKNGGCLPTTEQELLLGAALFAPAEAAAAWQAWRAQIDPEQDFIDPGSVRLLPLVYYNLRGQDLDDAYLAHLKHLYRQTLLTNQVQLYGCAKLVDLLQRAGIDTLALKGAALLNCVYPEIPTRPIGDFDVLVPREQAHAALAILDANGWRPVSLPRARIIAELLQVRHAQNFADADRHQFDLHWYALAGSMDAALDRELWAQAQPLTIHEVTTRTLSPTDQLLHVCVHGAAWASVPPVRWIPDAVMILRAAGASAHNPTQATTQATTQAIDWERLLHLARAHELSLPLHHTLSYLQEHILPRAHSVEPLPAHVLTTLAQMPTTATARRLFRAHTQRSSAWGQLPLLWARYRAYRRRARNAAGPKSARLLSFPRFIAVYYGYRDLREVLQWAVTRSGQRVRRLLFGRNSQRE